ncbi:hypothetical protein NPIL_239551 [Nephila pilipes]|uniref:Uncharacterized protein n=1 Tax=Nephila pilipes TaxID=299642 RepID=A0A8X6PV61_NEPPI|nr:hypothetical protein NPIL_239551 [Nephila pilipes]
MQDALALLGELLPFVCIHLHYCMQLMITLGRKCILYHQKVCKLGTSQGPSKKIRQRFNKPLSFPAAVCRAKIAFDMPDVHISEAFFLHQHYFRSIEELVEIEQRTVHQNSSEWRQERKLRITARDAKSIFSRVANFEALTTQILKQKNSSIQHIPAVKYGLETEDRVRSMVQHMYPQSIVQKTDLVIHPLD